MNAYSHSNQHKGLKKRSVSSLARTFGVSAIALALLAGTALVPAAAGGNTTAQGTSTLSPEVRSYLKTELANVDNLVWTGHLNPDTDAIGASLIAAHIYGGTPGSAGPPNPESRFAIDLCKAETPELIEDFTGKSVGIVDFNQTTQLPPSIEADQIVAIVDHHAIAGSPVNLAHVVNLDIRPWGSTATILADRADVLGVDIPAPLACMGMAAILSDTLNLTSTTTTDYDRYYAGRLAEVAGIDDMNAFAENMLLAKSDLSSMSALDIVLLDYKDFEFGGKDVGIGVAETLTPQDLIDRKQELRTAILDQKQKSNLDHLFFAIVDARDQKSYLLWGDDIDKDIAISAFGEDAKDDMLEVDNVVSRKNQIAPAIQSAVTKTTTH
ncbi:manganese-dependent inorganic pyrophosphatase [Roseibium sp. MMSF_3412]|uniref:manganese-dependent inorganic pyrophosphatase n=1 Tax=Roseibium sp. MMSF_3412 TaxID=3046712 RepID=UPI0027401F8C|nr:manganese-dependent inorganic pyrophosphatase [Roseibium sp. MMSF_3412]